MVDTRTTKELIGRIKELEEQNTALLVALEDKNAALNIANTEIYTTCNHYLETERYFKIRNALCDGIKIKPSAELLEARDQKRDAKLLMATLEDEALRPIPIRALAARRESGEWKPELGD